MKIETNIKNGPIVGILGWEKKSNDTLAQLESIPGNIAHPDTFNFPVIYKEVPGACYQTVIVKPANHILEEMIKTAKSMEKEGVRAIMGNCGFNALFQQELAEAVNVPLFTSSLLLVPLAYRFFGANQKIGIITADSPYLTKKHLRAVGITDDIPICIGGLERTDEFAKIRSDSNAALDLAKFKTQVLQVVEDLLRKHSPVGAIILECTDLPPFAAMIRRSTGLPVFDIVTLAHMVYEAIAGNRWPRLPYDESVCHAGCKREYNA
ncbi:aspartate/glutamate racemase family protein [candidate division KSB1 bacterium]|nr:aspartate/glutamate racemase family protein [candidate division KSB1 bacterium]